MRLNLAGVLVLMAMLGTVATAEAQQLDFKLGAPTYSGTGCPSGSASAAVSPDGKQLSVLFDSFGINTRGTQLERKACNLSIPMQLPAGYSVAVTTIDYRGFMNLPNGAWATLRSAYYFLGSSSVNFRHQFIGPVQEDYLKHDQLNVESWSRCGGDVNFNAQITLEGQKAEGREARFGELSATVDSADFAGGVVYNMTWKRCQENEPPPRTGDGGGGGGRFEAPKAVVGNVDGVALVGERAVIRGWACSTTVAAPISVHLYVDGPAGQGRGIGAYMANLKSEPAVEKACSSGANAHRFQIELSPQETLANAGKRVFVHGISPFGGSNNLLGQSGNFALPAPPPKIDRAPEGMFLAEGGVYYSNGSRYCGFVSWHHVTASTGRTDSTGMPIYGSRPSAMPYDGACLITRMPEGKFIANGTVYYSNGQDAFCAYSDPAHLNRQGGLGNALEYPSAPIGMRNDGICGG